MKDEDDHPEGLIFSYKIDAAEMLCRFVEIETNNKRPHGMTAAKAIADLEEQADHDPDLAYQLGVWRQMVAAAVSVFTEAASKATSRPDDGTMKPGESRIRSGHGDFRESHFVKSNLKH